VPIARERIVDLQIAEAMVRLGADEELEAIRAALFAPDERGELTVLACQMLGRLDDRAYGATLYDIAVRTGPPDEKAAEIRLAAVEALARMEPTRAPSDVPMGFLSSERPEVRAQAAATMGWIGDPSVLPALAAVLDDGNPYVQAAAAGAILRVRDR
jgi:HEAT repeat protein